MYYDENKVNIPEKLRDNPLFRERIKGMNFGFLSKRGYYGKPEIKAQPALMKDMGVNLVTLNLNICQDRFYSTKLYLDFEYSAGETELKEITDILHDNGIMVLFKPCMTCMDGQPMCYVSFPPEGLQIEGVRVDYRKEWFASYSKCIEYSATLCEKFGIEGLMIGAELMGVECCDKEWRDIIASVRKIYGGLVTYEFTPPSRKANELKWMEELDFLSYSYYPPACPITENSLTNPSYTQKDMYEFLLSRRERLDSVCRRFGNKPILFTEYGVRSNHGCIMHPCDITFPASYDGDEQAAFMAASAEVFKAVPQWMGFCWWKWDETQYRPHYHTDPRGDCGYTIQGKPAEKVFRELKL